MAYEAFSLAGTESRGHYNGRIPSDCDTWSHSQEAPPHAGAPSRPLSPPPAPIHTSPPRIASPMEMGSPRKDRMARLGVVAKRKRKRCPVQ